MSTKKRAPTISQKEVCARLRTIWESKAKELGLKQDGAALELGISQGAVGHYLSGRNAIGFEMMFRFAQLLRVHPYEIDPEFAKVLPGDLRLAVDAMLVHPTESAAYAYRTLTTAAVHLHEPSITRHWLQTPEGNSDAKR